MINFDAVDFSEHRSEEVISFFWCSDSVYIHVADKSAILYINVQFQHWLAAYVPLWSKYHVAFSIQVSAK